MYSTTREYKQKDEALKTNQHSGEMGTDTVLRSRQGPRSMNAGHGEIRVFLGRLRTLHHEVMHAGMQGHPPFGFDFRGALTVEFLDGLDQTRDP